jgi:hypothetical protein
LLAANRAWEDDGFIREAEYQELALELALPLHGTAADAVAQHYDFAALAAHLQPLYQHAKCRLERYKQRIKTFTDQHGFPHPDRPDKKLLCPLIRRVLLATLPEDEPVTAGSGGAPPVDFQAMLTAWELAPFYEVEDNAAALWRALANNPRFLRRCHFKDHHLPCLRCFQRFNEVMNFGGLWGERRRWLVNHNLQTGALAPPKRLAIDPGHQAGYATVGRAVQACRVCGGCEKEDQERTCEVTDVVTKRKTYQTPGVKGSFVGDADTDVPYLALALQARAFDGATGIDTAQAFAGEYPQLVSGVDEALLDGAYDDRRVKAGISEALEGAAVLTPINPRARKDRVVNDSRGIVKLDKYGVVHCLAGAMAYQGRDLVREEYRWGCPEFDRESGTIDCVHQGRCCPNPGVRGRQYRVARSEAPQVDWEHPQHSADFKARYNGRTSAERVIGRTKRSFPFERHWGRGRASYQGHLDKGVAAFHVLIATAHTAGCPEKARSPLTWHRRKAS